MSNRVTITFNPCNPAPALGYRVFYRLSGSSTPYMIASNTNTSTVYFPGSPIVFEDSILENGAEYEGYIVAMTSESSNCPHMIFSTGLNPGYTCRQYLVWEVITDITFRGFVQWQDCETGAELSSTVLQPITICSRIPPYGHNIEFMDQGLCTQ